MTDNIKLPPLPPWMERYEIPDDDFEGGRANLDSRMRSYALEAVHLNAQAEPDEERLAMEAVMESIDPATWPGLTAAQRCALGRFAKPQLSESAEPDVGRGESVGADDFRVCAIGDSNYAAGMLLGWNLCVDDDAATFTRIREDRLRAAGQASRMHHDVLPWESAPRPEPVQKRKPLTESAIQQIGLDMPSLLHPGGLIEFARAIERAHGITED